MKLFSFFLLLRFLLLNSIPARLFTLISSGPESTLDVAFTDGADKEMWFRLTRERVLGPQLEEICAVTALGMTIDCLERMKTLALCFDRTVFKRFKVRFDGRKFDLVLSSVMDLAEWSFEALLVCSKISSGIDENACAQLILAWGEGIATHVKALKPMRKDTNPEFVPSPASAAWHSIERDAGVVYIEPYDLLVSMTSEESGAAAFEANVPWSHLVIDGLVEPNLLGAVVDEVNGALNKSLHTLGTWRALNDKSQVILIYKLSGK